MGGRLVFVNVCSKLRKPDNLRLPVLVAAESVLGRVPTVADEGGVVAETGFCAVVGLGISCLAPPSSTSKYGGASPLGSVDTAP